MQTKARGKITKLKNIKSRYEITIVRELCIGAASCVSIAQKTYKLDKEFKAVTIAKPWDGNDKVLLAAKSCPTKAIIVTDKKTGKRIWP